MRRSLRAATCERQVAHGARVAARDPLGEEGEVRRRVGAREAREVEADVEGDLAGPLGQARPAPGRRHLTPSLRPPTLRARAPGRTRDTPRRRAAARRRKRDTAGTRAPGRSASRLRGTSAASSCGATSALIAASARPPSASGTSTAKRGGAPSTASRSSASRDGISASRSRSTTGTRSVARVVRYSSRKPSSSAPGDGSAACAGFGCMPGKTSSSSPPQSAQRAISGRYSSPQSLQTRTCSGTVRGRAGSRCPAPRATRRPSRAARSRRRCGRARPWDRTPGRC